MKKVLVLSIVLWLMSAVRVFAATGYCPSSNTFPTKSYRCQDDGTCGKSSSSQSYTCDGNTSSCTTAVWWDEWTKCQHLWVDDAYVWDGDDCLVGQDLTVWTVRGANWNGNCLVNTCGWGGCQPQYNENCGNCADCACTGGDVCSNGNCVAGCTSSNPGTPGLVSPADNLDIGPEVAQVTLDWNGVSWGTGCPSNNNQYQVYLEVNDATPDVLVSTKNSTTTASTENVQPLQHYYWQIVSNNGSRTTASVVWDFWTGAAVTGTLYDDPGGTCGGSGSNFGGTTVSLSGGYSDAVAVDGTFTIGAVTGSGYTLTVPIPADYICSTGCGTCPVETGVSAPGSGYNFYFTQTAEAWWQVSNGDIYAGSTGTGNVIQSLIPSSSYYLIEGDALAMRASGDINVGDSGGTLSSDEYQALSSYAGDQYDFNYWKANRNVASEISTIVGDLDDAAQLTNVVDEEYDYVDGNLTVSSLSVPVGDKYVVFVDGDLTITGDVIVPTGGFLVFVVSGSVTVDSAVTDVQGVYISDGDFQTLSSGGLDLQLVVEGIVVSWSNVSLARDMGVSNFSTPAEKFVYRTDLADIMQVYAMQWQEVAPGTF